MHETRRIRSHDGTELSCRLSGRPHAPVVVLCDGFGCDGFIWRYLAPHLAQSYRVIAWNYRGHGRSDAPTHPQRLDMDVLADDLRCVLDAFAVDRAVLIGHSMGVQLIFQAALRFGERVAALVPICGSYGQPLQTLRRFGLAEKVFPLLAAWVRRFPHASRRLWQAAMRSRLTLAYARAFEVNGAALQPDDLDGYFAHLAQMDPQLFMRMLDRIKAHTVEAQLANIHRPTLIIAATRDSFTPVWLSHRMHALLPQAELMELAAATHVAPLEFPALIHARLDAFLQQHAHNASATSMQLRVAKAPRPVSALS